MDFFYNDFDNCLSRTIYSLKMLLYRRHENIFERLDFNSDEIYQEPLLFAYITQNDTKWLDSIIYGYEKKPKNKINIYTNKKGIAYLPKIGYFKTNFPNAMLSLEKKDLGYLLKDEVDNVITFDFEAIYFLDDEIELIKTQHPLLECLFISPDGINVDVEIEKVIANHVTHFNNALSIIKNYYGDYYCLLKKNIKKVILFEGDPYSFASIQAHNMIFLSLNNEDDEIFFIDHIIHEGSHVIFNTLTYDSKIDLFTVPFTSSFSDFTEVEEDHGEIYGRFHGLFTQSNINICIEACLKNNNLDARQHHELLGRFSSNMKRFNAAVEKFNLPKLYKEEGLKWYNFFKTRRNQLTERNNSLINSFDVSNQPYVFSYKIFKRTNP